MPDYHEDELFSIRDLIDSQLETSDDVEIGRVADLEAVWREDGTLVLTSIFTGPQALAGRFSPALRHLARKLFRDHFDYRISLHEIESSGPTLRLRGKAAEYPLGSSERWIAKNILRWIPGSGYSDAATE